MNLEIGFTTHTGRVRSHNEDFVGVLPPKTSLMGRSSLPVFVVADGMGGHLGGEVASRSAVRAVISHFQQGGGRSARIILHGAMVAANQAVMGQAQNDSRVRDMGTTLVAATIQGDHLIVGNVGDSRAYLLEGESLRLVTEDHSLVEEQVRAGIITPEQAANAPGRNILSRALGREKNVETDLFEEPWASHTTLLLCSDGLWGTLPEPVMAEVISTMRPQEAVEELINVAMDEGSTDNISAVIVRESRET